MANTFTNELERATESQPSREELGVLQAVLRALRRIRHGQVQIIIQDGRVIQIDQTEKLRLSR